MTIEVLIVDDNDLNREILSEMLETQPCTVDMASNGHGAVQMAGQKQYDVILMDIMMPGFDGLEATKAIRNQANNQGVPPKIVAVTAMKLRANLDKFVQAGFNEYLPKPFSEEQAEKALRPLVDADHIFQVIK